MNTSTRPPEGAGGSRSTAAGELTLGLLSGGGYALLCLFAFFVGTGLARDDDLTADQSLTDVRHSKVW
ncbi:hypothetical protein ACQKP6_04165, partial [Pseudomonas fluorescens]|uniref:hypothetical protein n=1 Tax=Pseudomonas fluorescens TaxID=294 RepID=UPI003CFE3CCF